MVYCTKGSKAENELKMAGISYSYIVVDISKSSSKISVTGIVNQKYTGKKCTQTKLVVKSGSKTLKLGKDYQVSYENNVKPGKATVVITGIGNYTGTIKKTFAISIPKNAVYTVGGIKYNITAVGKNAFKNSTYLKKQDFCKACSISAKGKGEEL